VEWRGGKRKGEGKGGKEGRERGGRGPISSAGPGPPNTLRRLCVNVCAYRLPCYDAWLWRRMSRVHA